jgi:hypothetical protein
MHDTKLFKEDQLYRFFTRQIQQLDFEISSNSRRLKELGVKQAELKRGKTELVKLRREIVIRRAEKEGL